MQGLFFLQPFLSDLLASHSSEHFLLAIIPVVCFALKTPPSPHGLFDLQDSLDKLKHFLPQLSDFVPLKNGFYGFRAQTD